MPQGATCTLVGTRVDGSVKVYRNATLNARGVQVNGNVQADNFRRVEVTHRTVDGVVKRSRIGGSIQVKQGGGGEVRRTVVKADIQVFSNDGRWAIYNNTVDGNLQCKSNDPAPVGARNNVGRQQGRPVRDLLSSQLNPHRASSAGQPIVVPAERRFSQASTTRAAMPASAALPQARGS